MNTVEALRDELVRAGRTPDVVARVEDLGARRVDGMTLLRSLPDGRCRTVTWVRGQQTYPQVFDSEELAVSRVAEELLALPASGEPEDVRRSGVPAPHSEALGMLRNLRQRNRRRL